MGIDQNQGYPQLFFLVYSQVENKIMATPSSPIDINKASLEDLLSINGIGGKES